MGGKSLCTKTTAAVRISRLREAQREPLIGRPVWAREASAGPPAQARAAVFCVTCRERLRGAGNPALPQAPLPALTPPVRCRAQPPEAAAFPIYGMQIKCFFLRVADATQVGLALKPWSRSASQSLLPALFKLGIGLSLQVFRRQQQRQRFAMFGLKRNAVIGLNPTVGEPG